MVDWTRRNILIAVAIAAVVIMVTPVAYAYIAEIINSGNNADTKPMTVLVSSDEKDPTKLMEVSLPIPDMSSVTSESENGPWSFNDAYSKKITGYIYAQCPNDEGKMRVWVDMENIQSWSVVERITFNVYDDDLSKGAITFWCPDTNERIIVVNLQADAANTAYTLKAGPGYAITGVADGSTAINTSYNASTNVVTFKCSDIGLNTLALKVKADNGKTGEENPLTLSAGSGYTIKGIGSSSTVNTAKYNEDGSVTFQCNDKTDRIIVVKVKADYGEEGKTVKLTRNGGGYDIIGYGTESTVEDVSFGSSWISFKCDNLNEKVIAVKVRVNTDSRISTDLNIKVESGCTITGIGPLVSSATETKYVSTSDAVHILVHNAKVGHQYILFGADSELLEVGGEPNRIELPIKTNTTVEKGWEGKKFEIDVEYKDSLTVNPFRINNLLESTIKFVAAPSDPVPTLSVRYCLGHGEGSEPPDYNEDNKLIPKTYAYEGNIINPPTAPKGFNIIGWYYEHDSEGQGKGVQWKFAENHLDPDRYTGTKWTGKELTLYAKYEPIQYTITFQWDGVEVSAEDLKNTTYDVFSGNIDFQSQDDSKKPRVFENYNLRGWTGTGLSGIQTEIHIPAGSVGDRVYTAVWSYDVTFYKDSSETVSGVQKNIPRGSYTALTKTTWTVDTKDFYGWSLTKGGTERAYKDGGEVYNLGNANLYAIWTDKCTVTYNNTKFSEKTPPSPITDVVYGSSITLAGGAWAESADFIGWNTADGQLGIFYKPESTMVVEGAIVAANNVDLYAVKSDKTVTFKNNYSEIADVTQKVHSVIKVPLDGNPFPVPSEKVFLGWNSEADGTGQSYTPGELYEFAADTLLYAMWGHTVSFSANGGTGTMDSQDFFDNTSTVLNANTFTRPGYTFFKWNTEPDGTGVSYDDKGSFTKNVNFTLYAIWRHTVTYDGNEGTSAPTDPKMYADGATVTIKGKGEMVRSGYVFAGWNTSANGLGISYMEGDTFAISYDIKLYAMWGHTVTFYRNHDNEDTETSTQILRHDVPTALNPNEFTNTGLSFYGWNAVRDGTGTYYSDGSKITRTTDLDLYAIWGYAVTFDLAICPSGFETPDVQVVLNNNKAVEPDMGLDGYRVTWYKDKGLTNEFKFDTDTITNNITLYAKWEVKLFLIYNPLNGPDEKDTSRWVQYGVPVEFDFTLKSGQWGWNTNAQGRGAYFACSTVEVKHSYAMAFPQVLYAIWEDPTVQPSHYVPMNAHFISFYSNDGEGYMDKQRVPINDTSVIIDRFSKGHLYRDGWTFFKWNTTADGKGTYYEDGATINPFTDNMSLFAIWKPCVAYDANGGTGALPETHSYDIGADVTVADKPGTLERVGYVFNGWNTAADGSGTHYEAGNTFKIYDGVTLYAMWVHTVAYHGNGNSGGSAPVDSNKYADGDVVTVLGAGSLVKTGYTFVGWNTAADGSGADFIEGSKFGITRDTTLYAKWIQN